MVSQLIYTSDAAPGLGDAELAAILAAAHRNNPALGLTGMLLYGRGLFIQVLEGADDAIEAMMDRIESDPRTGNIRRLMLRSVDAPEFADWSMGFRQLSEADWARHPSVNGFFDDPPDMSHFKAFGSPARFLLQAFRDLQGQ